MVGESTSLPNFFHTSADQFCGTKFLSVESPDDIFSVLDTLEGVSDELTALISLDHENIHEFGVNDGCLNELASQKSISSIGLPEMDKFSPLTKRQKVSPVTVEEGDGNLKSNHVTVERNRRKQMNEHLTVLRSLMPCFYVKRGDQASIIGGVIDYITELQQVLQSLETKKQRKVYSDIVLSPRLILSPRKPPLSPRPSLPISPRTPQSASPYKNRLPSVTSYLLSPSSMANITPVSPCNSSSNSYTINELVANSKSPIADVKVKFSGANLILKTISPWLPCQATKIISVLEDLSLEILQARIDMVDDTMVNSFTIKIGIDCKLSAEDLAQHIQLTFC